MDANQDCLPLDFFVAGIWLANHGFSIGFAIRPTVSRSDCLTVPMESDHLTTARVDTDPTMEVKTVSAAFTGRGSLEVSFLRAGKCHGLAILSHTANLELESQASVRGYADSESD